VDVPVAGRSLDCYGDVVGAARVRAVRVAAARLRRALRSGRVWNVSSTARGGGVAEMLHVLLPYCRGGGTDARWTVAGGDPAFFEITKRLCVGLYGSPGDGGPLGAREHSHYRAVSAANAAGLAGRVGPGDVVVLHDPQVAGLAPHLRGRVARVVWRCHVGSDTLGEHARRAWAFLRPYLERVDAFVFSRREHVPGWIGPATPVAVIQPSLDPFAAKNAGLDPSLARAVLAVAGIVQGAGGPVDVPLPGGRATVRRRALVIGEGRLPAEGDPLVAQVSRWDRLKDMLGVLLAFDEQVDGPARLVLAGPDVAGVADDPEAAAVLEACRRAWQELPPARRARVQLACLPMDDPVENAVMVNALQRSAAVVVQKSVAEGFGLTVTEAMWKARPVVASAVGGIRDQIVDGVHGLLVERPEDLAGCGRAIRSLLADPAGAAALGRRAQERVADRFLGDRHLRNWAGLLTGLLEA